MSDQIIMAILMGIPGLLAFVYGLVGCFKDEHGAGTITGFGGCLIFISLCMAGIIPL